MDTMLVAVFESAQEASIAVRVLEDLHAAGSVFVYGLAVVLIDSDNIAMVSAAGVQSSLDLALGAATKLLSKLIVARSGCDYIPAVDLPITMAKVGIDKAFLDEASRHFLPGRAAVVSEIEGEGAGLIVSMGALDRGIVCHCTRSDSADAWMAEELDAADREVRMLEDEITQTLSVSKEDLRRKLDLARTRQQAAKATSRCLAVSVKREAEAKIVSLQKHAALAGGCTKERLKKLIDEVRDEYINRATKLNFASRIAGDFFGA
jgi:hypothetical protein